MASRLIPTCIFAAFLLMISGCDDESIDDCHFTGTLPDNIVEENDWIEISASLFFHEKIVIFIHTADSTDNRFVEDHVRVAIDVDQNGRIDSGTDVAFESPKEMEYYMCEIDPSTSVQTSNCIRASDEIGFESGFGISSPPFNKSHVIWSISVPLIKYGRDCGISFVVQTISDGEVQNWPPRTSNNDGLNFDFSNTYYFNIYD